MTKLQHLAVRPTKADDVPDLTRLLNEIIEIGGSTAYETPFSEAEIEKALVTGEGRLCCHTAVDLRDGSLAGYQSLARNEELPENWADIATFARPKPKLPGVGTALFEATSSFARDQGFIAINATIRADNKSGVAYYTKMGFRDYGRLIAVPLRDGTPVDRVMKRYDVAART